MKYTLLDNKSSQRILNRIQKLSADHSPLWGVMSVNDMMFHCAVINEEILKGTENKKKATLKQKMIRTLVLRGFRHLPKGIQTNKRFIKPKEDMTEFEYNKNRLIDSVNRVSAHNNDIFGNHPYFGPLNTSQWRRFMYMHLDHHLHQFNV